jgi:tRNA(fMet)-specific endonuclease VapC
MLDTDIVSFAMRGEPAVVANLVRHRRTDLCVSALTLAELRYGIELKNSSRLGDSLERVVNGIAILPFDGTCALRFAQVASALTHAGTPIGGMDTLVGAHALTLGLTLVTNNLKHFTRIPGLTIENWL